MSTLSIECYRNIIWGHLTELNPGKLQGLNKVNRLCPGDNKIQSIILDTYEYDVNLTS